MVLYMCMRIIRGIPTILHIPCSTTLSVSFSTIGRCSIARKTLDRKPYMSSSIPMYHYSFYVHLQGTVKPKPENLNPKA